MCVGINRGKLIPKRYKIPILNFHTISDFIFERFYKYQEQKSQHDQWDNAGQRLWELFELSVNNTSYKQEPNQAHEVYLQELHKKKKDYFKRAISKDIKQYSKNRNLK